MLFLIVNLTRTINSITAGSLYKDMPGMRIIQTIGEHNGISVPRFLKPVRIETEKIIDGGNKWLATNTNRCGEPKANP
jgi:hypothetical protein